MQRGCQRHNLQSHESFAIFLCVPRAQSSIRNNCRNNCCQKGNTNILQMLWKTIPHLFSLTFFNISNFSKKHVYPGMTKDFKYYSHNPVVFTLRTALGLLHNFHLLQNCSMYVTVYWFQYMLDIWPQNSLWCTLRQFISHTTERAKEKCLFWTPKHLWWLKSTVLCQEEAVC